MEPNEALVVANLALADSDAELPATRKVIAAVPAGKEEYSPDGKSMNALKLAWHTASSDVWFLNSIADGKFVPGSGDIPAEIKTAADVAAWYDANRGPAAARVKGMSADALAASVDFFGMMNMPAAWYVAFNLRHLVHHRAQLSTYLRPMGAKVPSIYGPSADEPMS